MPASFQQILNSRLFKFIIGESVDGKQSEFSIHEDAIAQLSKPLNTLTKSGPEARAACATWKDVSKETFERFAQYAYTGDYSIPKTGKRITAVPPKANGIHSVTTNGVAETESTENTTPTQPFSPSAPNVLRSRIDSLGSDEVSPVEVRDGSVSDKMEDGAILNYPMPSKSKAKKNKKAARLAQEKVEREKAEREAKGAELKGEVISEQEPQPEPQPEEVQPAKTQQAKTEPVGPEAEPEAVLPTTGEGQPQQQHILTVDFKSLSYTLLASRDNYEGTCEPGTNFEPDHSYSNVFLSHASLYILGEVQLVEPLKALALFKLHRTLCAFELDGENIGDITDLARYAYSWGDQELSDGIGGLRGLVCQYMAIHAKELSDNVEFMNLLAGGGQIVKDFFRFQLQRIN